MQAKEEKQNANLVVRRHPNFDTALRAIHPALRPRAKKLIHKFFDSNIETIRRHITQLQTFSTGNGELIYGVITEKHFALVLRILGNVCDLIDVIVIKSFVKTFFLCREVVCKEIYEDGDTQHRVTIWKESAGRLVLQVLSKSAGDVVQSGWEIQFLPGRHARCVH